MNLTTNAKGADGGAVDKIVAALLYEGYILYPYRASAVKNRQRFNFGTLFPKAYSESQTGTDAWATAAEVIVIGESPSLAVRVRFLHPVARQVGRFARPLAEFDVDRVPQYEPVAALELGDEIYQTWDEVVERELIAALDPSDLDQPQRETVTFAASKDIQPLQGPDGTVAGVVVRTQQPVTVGVEIVAQRIDSQTIKLRARVENQTPLIGLVNIRREDALPHALASAHIILCVADGEFVSAIDPPDEHAAAVAACQQDGCWPVLVGEEGQRRQMLASPIILYDYPHVAAERDGAFFDGTEIDEMLALRVMTLTDEEKRQMRSVDARARQILQRNDGMSDDHMMQLHGRLSEAATSTREAQP